MLLVYTFMCEFQLWYLDTLIYIRHHGHRTPYTLSYADMAHYSSRRCQKQHKQWEKKALLNARIIARVHDSFRCSYFWFVCFFFFLFFIYASAAYTHFCFFSRHTMCMRCCWFTSATVMFCCVVCFAQYFNMTTETITSGPILWVHFFFVFLRRPLWQAAGSWAATLSSHCPKIWTDPEILL